MKANSREYVSQSVISSLPGSVRERIDQQEEIADNRTRKGLPRQDQNIEIRHLLDIGQAARLRDEANASRAKHLGGDIVLGVDLSDTTFRPFVETPEVNEGPSPEAIEKLLRQNAKVVARAQETGEGEGPKPEAVAKIFANANSAREIADGQDPSTPSISMEKTTFVPSSNPLARTRRRPR